MRTGVHTISVRTPFTVGRANCYLLLGAPLTLVDTGPLYPEALADLEAGFSEAGQRLDDLELLLLTHQHADHVGLAGRLKEQTGCVVAAHETLLPILADAERNAQAQAAYQASVLRVHGAPHELIEELVEAERVFHRYNGSVTLDRRLGDGERVVAGGRSLTAWLRPGHSPSDTVFVDELARRAFCGDHLVGQFASNPLIHAPIGAPPDPHGRESTIAVYRESLRRTAADDLELLYPGHGDPITDVGDLIESRFALQADRTEHVGSRVPPEGTTAYEITRAIWPLGKVNRRFLALSEVLGCLDLLEAAGRVRRRRRGDVIHYEPV
jgi:glyoxylase-like metal-dependent hydrolase (beta-lactamase superfamily II)